MDPEGYYARLGVPTDAAAATIAAAYRAKARLLHPDVPVTGNAGAFILLHEAYEVLGDELSRARYDRSAREAAREQAAAGAATASRPVAPQWAEAPPVPPMPEIPAFLSSRRLALGLWGGLIVLTAVSLTELIIHVARMVAAPLPNRLALLSDTSAATDDLPMVPVGVPTHYVLPTGGTAPLWRYDAAQSRYLPAAHLQPFTGVEVLDTPSRDGMVEVRVSAGHGFIDATRLAPGGVKAARRAYCSYNAGPPLAAGEVLARHGGGDAALRIDSPNAEPVVLKLRDASGTTALTVQAMQGTTKVAGLAPGAYSVEYATGTLWSRACGSFVAGERTWRLPGQVMLAGEARLTVPAANAVEISPDAFTND
jgi:hypothetical protein